MTQKKSLTFYLICGSLILNRHIKITYTHMCHEIERKKCLIGKKDQQVGWVVFIYSFILDGSQLRTQRPFNYENLTLFYAYFN